MKRLLRVILVLSLIVIVSIGVLLAMSWSSFGSRPTDEDLVRFESSPQFVKEKKGFENRIPDLMARIRARLGVRDIYKSAFGGVEAKTPVHPLPVTPFDRARFLAPGESIKVVWLGHSSLLLNFAGSIVLIDPVFSGNASPLPFGVSRFQQPPIALEDLPPVDSYVVTHDHYDHLDLLTVKYFSETSSAQKTNQKTKFVVPLGIGGHLRGWGIAADRITEFDWWQTKQIGALEFTLTPAQHASGRNPLYPNDTLWGSWVVRHEKLKAYFSGDSGYDIHFKQIGDKFGPFDVAFVENGQYNLKWPEVHMLPDQTIRAFKDLNAKALFPIHWGMFSLSMHPWFEPISATYATSLKEGLPLVAPQLGEVVEFGQPYVTKPWWEKR